MQVVKIKGKAKQVFVIADGDENTIVIPIEYLAAVDYHRLVDIEAKGGTMLKHMRDTRLDNGVLAIEAYHKLFVVVPKPQKKAEVKTDPTNSVDNTVVEVPKKRGRGRPKTVKPTE